MGSSKVRVVEMNNRDQERVVEKTWRWMSSEPQPGAEDLQGMLRFLTWQKCDGKPLVGPEQGDVHLKRIILAAVGDRFKNQKQDDKELF